MFGSIARGIGRRIVETVVITATTILIENATEKVMEKIRKVRTA